MRKSVVACVVALWCLAACVPGRNDYSGFEHIPQAGWAYSAPVEFVAQPADSAVSGALTIAVRHSNSYPYSNLWLEVSTYRGDKQVGRDTVNMRLADIYGRWLGHGLGTSYQITDTLPRIVDLCRGDRIVMRHVMRVDTLPGIEQVGVSFTAR
ncbi:MAG: gliding motility lipoprotein GldH [Muribaculaceae bacterium]|nr:gliding motility lipoprotein GldH [Muribaculaceae bacterium]